LQNMVKDVKVDTLIEFGPSDTLSKFARKVVDKTVNRYSVSDMASYEKLRNILETQV
jgi:[acyl-carrier-protein] S-malonyltransferase